MESNLTGRMALVTGGGRGVGAATAQQLAAAGVAKIVLVARSSDELAETAERVRAAGAETHVLAIDLADAGAPDQLASAVQDVVGGVDILVSAAATVAPLGPTQTLAVADVRRALDLNVAAPILVTGALLNGMIERGWGRIVNVSSGVAAHPTSMIGGTVYAASKAALEAHTLNLAGELRGTGVMANVYRPGVVDTAMQGWIRDQDPERIGAGLHDRFVGMHDSGRLITAEASAGGLVDRLLNSTEDNGAIWDVADAPA